VGPRFVGPAVPSAQSGG
jgi:hypothetical protein